MSVSARFCVCTLVLLPAFAGCSPGDSDGGMTGGADVFTDASDAGARNDGTMGGSDLPDGAAMDGDAAASGPCSVPTRGATTFSTELSGEADFPIDQSARTLHAGFGIQVNFPAGRVAGAPVIFAHPIVYPRPGLLVLQATLDDNLGVAALHLAGTDGREFVFNGALVGPDDGVAGTLQLNFADPYTDVATYGRASLRLCPGGPPGPFTYSLWQRSIAPTTPLWVGTSSPLDPTTLDFTVQTAAGDVPVTAAIVYGSLRIAPRTAFPPNQALRLIARNVTDIVGRPAVLSADLPYAATSSEVTDRTFASALPTGAIATDAQPTVANGRLVLTTPQGGPWSALVALGDPGGQTTSVRVRQLVRCASTEGFTVTLVAGDGSVTPVPVQCDNADHDAIAVVPGAGALWLSIVDDSPVREPQFLPAGTSYYSIDEIAFQ